MNCNKHSSGNSELITQDLLKQPFIYCSQLTIQSSVTIPLVNQNNFSVQTVRHKRPQLIHFGDLKMMIIKGALSRGFCCSVFNTVFVPKNFQTASQQKNKRNSATKPNI